LIRGGDGYGAPPRRDAVSCRRSAIPDDAGEQRGRRASSVEHQLAWLMVARCESRLSGLVPTISVRHPIRRDHSGTIPRPFERVVPADPSPKTSVIFERDTGFEPATLSLGRCCATYDLGQLQAILKSCVYSRPTPSDRVSPVSSLNRPTARAIPLHIRVLAAELLARGKEALDAVASQDRSAMGRLNDALTVAMQLADVTSGKRRSADGA
jgi:hypothetical protein